MDKYYKALVIVPLVVILVLGVLYFYLSSTSSTDKSSLDSVPVADTEQPEGTATVEVGTKEISSGSVFGSIEEGYIYYTEKGVDQSAKTSTDEMVLACTNQTLEGLTELDFDQVSAIKVITPAEVGTRIVPGTSVVVLSNNVDGQYIAHTVAVNDLTLCN